MSCSRSSVVASSVRVSVSLSACSVSVVRIHARSSRHGVVGHTRHGLSVPLRWRPAHGTRSAISLRSRRGASLSQAWAPRAGGIAGFGHEGWAVPAPITDHLQRLPVSQRLKPQCLVMQTHLNAKLSVSAFATLVAFARVQSWLPIVEVLVSKSNRRVVHQPPNPSFKRTCLWHAA